MAIQEAPSPVLECRALSVSYRTRAGDVPAVVDFDLTLTPGEAHGLVGESGCGKSTVALAIMRYLGANGHVTGGEIRFMGRDLSTLKAGELRKVRGSGIAMVYQEPMSALNPSMTVADQLAEVAVYQGGLNKASALAQAHEMLERVRLADRERIMASYPHQISGGQQQRVVIAMALLANPSVLILDEPTTALDVTVEAGIVDLIKEISAQYGMAMLYISHNLGLIRETCDRISVMYAGSVVETGSVGSVFRRMRHPYSRGLFSSIPVPGSDKSTRPLTTIPGQLPSPFARPKGCHFGPRCEFFASGVCDARPIALAPADGDAKHLTRCVRAADIDWEGTGAPAKAPPRQDVGPIALSITGVSKYYGRVRANRAVSFDARMAETVAIVGESGCGKSTLARIIMGLGEASSGSIKFGHLELSKLPVSRRRRETIRSLQMIFQNPFDTLNPSHTVGGQIAHVVRKFGLERDEGKIGEKVLNLLDMVKLPREFAGRKPRQLSGGQKQRVGIARAFAGTPQVVVADEPVSALDVSVQAAITQLLMEIQGREGTTLLFISHDLSIVRYLADRVVVMYLGEVLERGRTAEVFAPPYHPYTELLLSAVPLADLRFKKRKVVAGDDMPSPSNPPEGCPFSTRCSYAIAGVCAEHPPPIRQFSDEHQIACHLPVERLLSMEPMLSALSPEMMDNPSPPKDRADAETLHAGGLPAWADQSPLGAGGDR